MPTALITGILGQDGSYLAEELTSLGYAVHGLVQPGMEPPSGDGRTYHVADLTDVARLRALVTDLAPERIFHLAGISSVAQSWHDPAATMAVNATGSVVLLEAALAAREASGEDVRFVQASSAEIFGQAEQSPQNELTPIRPINPYGVSKAAAHLAVATFRARGLHASSMILYNHESPRRPAAFVTRKITSTAAKIARGEASELRLGNLAARRDWGWAPDYTHAMVLAADAPAGDDYVIATGISHSVSDLVDAAFTHCGITDWQRHVVVDPEFFRPVDATELRGDASKARDALGWRPSVTFPEMVAAMVDADLR